MITFGPVPSRRLGRSLGINNIPPKSCTYSCVYCQLGRTKKMEAEFRSFYEPEAIRQSVAQKARAAEERNEPIDYLTFVPDGEPTLDINLGREIELLRTTGKRVAVITNSSLLCSDRVKNHLQKADWVSVKLDAVDKRSWEKINRPHRSLNLDIILNAIAQFARQFRGTLVTETMLVRNLNDSEEQMKQLPQFIKNLPLAASYLSIPTRPPAEKWVQPPTEETLIRSFMLDIALVKWYFL